MNSVKELQEIVEPIQSLRESIKDLPQVWVTTKHTLAKIRREVSSSSEEERAGRTLCNPFNIFGVPVEDYDTHEECFDAIYQHYENGRRAVFVQSGPIPDDCRGGPSESSSDARSL